MKWRNKHNPKVVEEFDMVVEELKDKNGKVVLRTARLSRNGKAFLSGSLTMFNESWEKIKK